MATNVKNNLTIAAGPPGANVLSVIAGAHAANGAYDSGTGVHAEVDAITNVGQVNWANALTITTNKEPCPRCAVILRAFVTTYGWTVQAPAHAFASNYTGAYSLPDNVLDAIIGALAPALVGDEGTHYRDQIRTTFLNFGVT